MIDLMLGLIALTMLFGVFLLSVRQGLVSLDAVLEAAEALEREMKLTADSCSLPEQPDHAAVEAWMLKMYIRSWSADRATEDIREDTELYKNLHRVQ